MRITQQDVDHFNRWYIIEYGNSAFGRPDKLTFYRCERYAEVFHKPKNQRWLHSLHDKVRQDWIKNKRDHRR